MLGTYWPQHTCRYANIVFEVRENPLKVLHNTKRISIVTIVTTKHNYSKWWANVIRTSHFLFHPTEQNGIVCTPPLIAAVTVFKSVSWQLCKLTCGKKNSLRGICIDNGPHFSRYYAISYKKWLFYHNYFVVSSLSVPIKAHIVHTKTVCLCLTWCPHNSLCHMIFYEASVGEAEGPKYG